MKYYPPRIIYYLIANVKRRIDNFLSDSFLIECFGEGGESLEDLSRKLGIRISYYRRLRSLSQEDLAERVSCSVGYLAQLEAPLCRKLPSLPMLYAIAESLEITASELLDFT
jgi:DNA-binding XRE family transcriptional regulator